MGLDGRSHQRAHHPARGGGTPGDRERLLRRGGAVGVRERPERTPYCVRNDLRKLRNPDYSHVAAMGSAPPPQGTRPRAGETHPGAAEGGLPSPRGRGWRGGGPHAAPTQPRAPCPQPLAALQTTARAGDKPSPPSTHFPSALRARRATIFKSGEEISRFSGAATSPGDIPWGQGSSSSPGSLSRPSLVCRTTEKQIPT